MSDWNKQYQEGKREIVWTKEDYAIYKGLKVWPLVERGGLFFEFFVGPDMADAQFVEEIEHAQEGSQYRRDLQAGKYRTVCGMLVDRVGWGCDE